MKAFFYNDQRTIYIQFVLVLLLSNIGKAQTPGLIFKPATGAGLVVLDPNADGYSSITNSGFVTNDRTESEIPFVPLVFPMVEPIGDLGPGPDCGFTDFVDSGVEDLTLSYFDGTNLLFRMRIGIALPASKGYSVLIDTDQKFGLSGANADLNATSGNPGFEIEINLQTNFGVYVYNVDGACPGAPASSFAGETNYQKSIALSTNCSNPDYFYDFYVPFSALTALGITTSTPLRMAVVTQMNPAPGICNNALSDFGGINDASCGSNPSTCWQYIIDNYPPTCVTCSNSGDRSLCPAIASPIAENSTIVTGTVSEANGTSIKVYKNGSLIGSTTVSSGAWTLLGISPALVGNDIVTATATAAGESESIANCNPVTVGVTCTGAVTSVTACNAGKAFSGTGTIGALIKVYFGISTTPLTPTSGNVFSAGTITVDGSGNWLWRCVGSGQTLSCTAGGGPCLAEGSYRITQTLGAQCESAPTYICIGGGAQTAAPVITTSPILITTTSVSGTAVSGASITLYANGVQIGTVVATGTNWTINGLSLSFGQVITAKAISGALCLSNASNSVTVSRNTLTPAVTGTYCTSTTITSVTGTSSEAAGTVIQVYKNAVAHGSTTTVASNSTWTASTGISFSPGDNISAKATATGCIQSGFSNTVAVGSKTTNAVSITTNPIYEGASSVSGSGTNGDQIRLYIDGIQVGSSVVVSGGVWTISSLTIYELYASGSVTATAASTGKCESNPSSEVVVSCIAPLANLTVNPNNASICSGSIVDNISVLSSELYIVYQLFHSGVPTGSSVLGTGGTITLNSGTISSNITVTVKALKIGISCETALTENIPVTMLTLTSNAGPDQNVCSTTATLVGNTPSVGTGIWTLISGTGNISSPSSPTSGVTDLGPGSSTFRWTISYGSCTPAADDIIIAQDDVPTTSSAGSDQNVCSTSATLDGNTPAVGTGTWTLISGSATITTANSPTSGVTDLGVGANTFRWTISNGSCTPSTDDIIITRDVDPTTSNAGPDQNVCSTTATLDGNTPSVGTGIWTLISGPGTINFSDAFSPISTATASTFGTYQMQWSILYNSCSSNDDVQITFNDFPVANAGSNSPVMETTTLLLNSSGGLTYLWAGPNSFNSTLQNPSVPLVTLADAGTYSVTVTDAAGCTASATTLVVVGDDTDGDGVVNSIDQDDDNDGIADIDENIGDTDGDGIIDVFDLDSDNDGITDVLEAGGFDPDGDGIIGAGTIADTDGDGLSNLVDVDNGGSPLTVIDTDGDGITNNVDLDSDNDGITDLSENGNGLLDSNNDGILDGSDTDNDGIINAGTIDSNIIFGGSNSLLLDTDGDGTANYADLDSDNDGIHDSTENGFALLDVNNDGIIDEAEDTDGDGLANVAGIDVNATFGASSFVPLDSDADGIANYQDIDSDNDGIVDIIEGQITEAYDMPVGSDGDADGIDNGLDQNAGFGGSGTATDTDADGIPDFLDLDSDGDGDSDAIEAWDTDNDGIADLLPSGNDTDNDGLDDTFDLVVLTNITGANGTNSTNAGTSPYAFPNLDEILTPELDWREELGGPLPIELLTFTAEWENQDQTAVMVKWTTATETNNDYFEIQRATVSANCIPQCTDEWEIIGKISGAGNSTIEQDYSFEDDLAPLFQMTNVPNSTSVVYYRLKQFDFDGLYSYSEIAALIRQNQFQLISIYPNPSNNLLNVILLSEEEGFTEIKFINSVNQIMLEEKLTATKGLNKYKINIAELPSGTYFISINVNNRTEINKIVISK